MEGVLTLLLLVGASGAAAVPGLEAVVLAVEVAVQAAVDVQVGVAAEQTRMNSGIIISVSPDKFYLILL